MNKLPRYIIISIIVLGFVAFFVPAQTLAAPDQRCWKKSDCIKALGDFHLTGEDAENGFYPASKHQDALTACKGSTDLTTGEEMGFCKTVGKAETKIGFGGRRSFENFGEFIKYIFKYSIPVGIIIAIVMIIISGAQWTLSGGNSSTIESARKRIGGAVIGLILLLFSYNILKIVNPYLVNLRLPQVWLINPTILTPAWCDQVPVGKNVAPLRWLSDPPLSDSELMKRYESAKFTQDPRAAVVFDGTGVATTGSVCGHEYLVQDGGGITCQGRNCRESSICMPTRLNMRLCAEGSIGGAISASKSLFCDDLATTIMTDLKLMALCNEGDIEEISGLTVANIEPDAEMTSYLFPKNLVNKAENICSDQGGAAGYFLKAKVNDEGGGLTGSFCPGAGLSGGVPDWHVIGKSGQNECGINLGKLASQLLFGKTPNCAEEDGDERKGAYFCSCGVMSPDSDGAKLAQNKLFTDHLITIGELKTGYLCDIRVDRAEFPGLDNSDAFYIPDINSVNEITDCSNWYSDRPFGEL